MKKIQDWLQKYLFPIAARVEKQKHLQAVKDGIVAIIPIIIIGSFCLIPFGVGNLIGGEVKAWVDTYSAIFTLPTYFTSNIMSVYAAAFCQYYFSYLCSKQHVSDGDRPMFFVHAIRYLCSCEKDRSSDLLKNICIKGFAMGRDSFHFLHEGSKVFPQAEIDNDYKERYEEILKKYDPEQVTETTFKFNGWQY